MRKHFIDPWRGISPRRRRMVLQWTFLGTLGCVIFSVLFNVALFWSLDGEAQLRAMIGSTVIPVLLGVPLFLFLSLKLRQLAIANHRLEQLASTDELTGCLNRGAFSSIVDDWLTRQSLREVSGALLIIDADHFKRVNDRFGHDQGDIALRLIAGRLTDVLRSGDMVGRMGGEEFGIFLPGAGLDHAEEIAQRVRQAISETEFKPGARRHGLTVSIGCACFTQPVGFTELFKFADERLYEAKRAGRNRVIMGTVDPNYGSLIKRNMLH